MREAGLLAFLEQAGLDPSIAPKIAPLYHNPNDAKRVLADVVGDSTRVHVSGPVGKRMISLRAKDGAGILASWDGKPLSQLGLYDRHGDSLGVDPKEQRSIVLTTMSDRAWLRLVAPVTLLVSLYVPENFPSLRFPLNLGLLARAAREPHAGEVHQLDFQFGADIASVSQSIERLKPDIVGLSATFGQFEILRSLLVELERSRLLSDTQVLIGGSLPALLGHELGQHIPAMTCRSLWVCTSSGEGHLKELVSSFDDAGPKRPRQTGMLDLVNALDQGGEVTPTEGSAVELIRNGVDPRLELDLLPVARRAGAAFQLETSRGCTHACSFCPRSHKGPWRPANSAHLEEILWELANSSGHPSVPRRIFLVDEEFFGSAGRRDTQYAIRTAAQLSSFNFRWETSTRLDQVYRPDLSEHEQVERLEAWLSLVPSGLDRCLFGVESGVSTIIERFRKGVTSRQSEIAIRLISLMGIPRRFTYITFDPLMTRSELRDTVAFLQRRDLILTDLGSTHTPKEMLLIALDDTEAAAASTGMGFYTEVTYPLVSLEVLLGSSYFELADAAGLLGQVNPTMGKREARFADTAIEAAAGASQRWIDRHFALDYTLKGLHKIANHNVRARIAVARACYREASNNLLVGLEREIRALPADGDADWTYFEPMLGIAARALFTAMEAPIEHVIDAAPKRNAEILDSLYTTLGSQTFWDLIN